MNLYDLNEFPAAATGFIDQILENYSTSLLITDTEEVAAMLRNLMYFGSRDKLVEYLEDNFLQYV